LLRYLLHGQAQPQGLKLEKKFVSKKVIKKIAEKKVIKNWGGDEDSNLDIQHSSRALYQLQQETAARLHI